VVEQGTGAMPNVSSQIRGISAEAVKRGTGVMITLACGVLLACQEEMEGPPDVQTSSLARL
jgi:hypothetical protein